MVTPGREGHAEAHVEVSEALATELGPSPGVERFRAVVKGGQARVERVERLQAVGEPVYTILAFDQSGSFHPFTADAVALARKLVRSLPDGATSTVLSFGVSLGEPREATGAAATEALLDEVSKAKLQPQTRLKASIREATALASQKLPSPRGERQVVVFTDAGEESGAYTIAQVVRDARDRGVRVHVVVFGSSQQNGATLAQRRDEMKKLAEETGGVSVEVGHDRNAAGAAIERIGRAYPWVYRVELGFCEVPASPPLRDDQLRVEVRRGGAVAGVSEWVPFEQQAGGLASQACAAAAAPGISGAGAPSAPPVASARAVSAAPTGGASPLRLLPFLAGAGLVALLLAVALRRRPTVAAPPVPAPAPTPPPPVPIPVLAPQVDAGAAAAAFPAGRRGQAPPLELVVLRGPLAGQRVPIGVYPFVVGADAAAQLCLDIPEVSGRHASLEPAETGALILVDLSTNGTYVDGQRITRGQRVRVSPGQLLGFSTKAEARLVRRGE
jgi:hypothetical protein